jgi:hypothetical protein
MAWVIRCGGFSPIGRLFTTSDSFLEKYGSRHFFTSLYHSQSYVKSMTKIGWVKCWTIFPQTHVATLIMAHVFFVAQPDSLTQTFFLINSNAANSGHTN